MKKTDQNQRSFAANDETIWLRRKKERKQRFIKTTSKKCQFEFGGFHVCSNNRHNCLCTWWPKWNQLQRQLIMSVCKVNHVKELIQVLVARSNEINTSTVRRSAVDIRWFINQTRNLTIVFFCSIARSAGRSIRSTIPLLIPTMRQLRFAWRVWLIRISVSSGVREINSIRKKLWRMNDYSSNKNHFISVKKNF